MRLRPIHKVVFAAALCCTAPALAQDDYPLPVLDTDDPYAVGTDYDYDWEPPVAPAAYAPEPLAYAAGAYPLGYSEAQRAGWLAECRALVGQSLAYGTDACGDYLARYEAGTGGSYDYGPAYGAGYGQYAAQGCCSCGCGCASGHGHSGGGGCKVSYRFAPLPVIQLVPQQTRIIQRVIETEEWVDEPTAVRAIPEPRPVKTVPVKTVPVKTVPVKTTSARSVKSVK